MSGVPTGAPLIYGNPAIYKGVTMQPSTYHAQTKSGVFYTFIAQPGENHSSAWRKAITLHRAG